MMHYFILIYFNSKPLHVSSRHASRHEEDQLCQQPVKISQDYTSCCLYRVDPPNDEQQACSKHVEAYLEIN